jgi:PAS domain-containing protein
MAEYKHAKDAFRESEVRYRRLFETTKDGILLLDAISGQITDVNPFLITFGASSQTEWSEREMHIAKFINLETIPKN